MIMKTLTLAAVCLLACSPALADNNDRSISVCNYRGHGWSDRIIHVYATSVERGDWGEDKLDGHINVGDCRTISPGATGGYCMVDWRAEDASGRTVTKRIDSCRESTWAIRRM
jgi:hypothetical protein